MDVVLSWISGTAAGNEGGSLVLPAILGVMMIVVLALGFFLRGPGE